MEATESSYNEWDASRTELQDDKFTNFQGTFANATASGSISKSSMVSYLDVSTMTLHRNTCSLSISVVMAFLH